MAWMHLYITGVLVDCLIYHYIYIYCHKRNMQIRDFSIMDHSHVGKVEHSLQFWEEIGSQIEEPTTNSCNFVAHLLTST